MAKDAIDKEKRTATMSFASSEPVERYYGREVLSFEGSACDVSRLNNGAPLLINHDPNQVIGVVEKAYIKDGRGYADVRFSKSEYAECVFQDVLDGIRGKVSVGYRVNSIRLQESDGDEDTYAITDWQPYELSIVSIPADDSVGVGRAVNQEEREVKITMNKPLLDMQATGGGGNSPSVVSEPKFDVGAERVRTAEIYAIANKFNAEAEDVKRAIEGGHSVDSFKAVVLEKRFNAKPVQASASIGMSEKEVRRWSLTRAISVLGDKRQLDGIEKEASDAVAGQIKRTAGGFFIPEDIVNSRIGAGVPESEVRALAESIRMLVANRTLQANTGAGGGYLVGTNVLGANLIELLRNAMQIQALGATSLSGLVGDVAIPRQLGGATTYWLSESSSGSAADQSFGQLGLTPKRLFAATGYSKQLLAQASLDVEAFVRSDLMKVIAIELDRAAINGNGAAGEPLGILNTTGVGSVTFGATATFNKVIAFETNVANSNADRIGPMAYLSTPNVRGAWKGIQKATNYPLYLWDTGANGEGMVNGYRAAVSKNVPSDKVIFGAFSEVIYATWAGMDVVVDPYTLAGSGQIKVTLQLLTDIGLRHPAAFCISSDSGNQ
jgi:HK97 family phage major capsid protein